MSSPDDSFKVIIVGGGIAGLALANMLEKFEIDYVLLEAHDNIAPAAGASIALYPNGLLILDQIGCYEPVRAVAQSGIVRYTHVRRPDGSSVCCIEDLFGHLGRSHGYELLFFDRQWLLEVLFNQLKHKDRIMLKSRVETIEQFDDGIRVTTKAGKTYTGSVVVGADGIHSTVRHEMRRLAHLSDDPGCFPSEEEEQAVPCYYQCSFGIAKDVEKWPERNHCFTSGEGHAFLVASGPMNKVYWFMFKRLSEVKFGKDIPRYTKQDEEAFMRINAHVSITEDLTFGQLFERRIFSTLTPLHEIVFRKWFWGRMISMGDSIHKSNPMLGMGGNSAIETAAVFVNFLLKARDNRPNGLDGLTTGEIEAISRHTQNARYERAQYIVKMGHDIQALFASERPLLTKLVLNVIFPLSGLEHQLGQMGSSLLGSPKLNLLPVPLRPRMVPYDHELPAKPVRGWPLTVIKTVFSAAMGLGLAYPVQARPVLNAQLQRMYLLSQTISPLLTYTIEGHRGGNQGTLLSLPSLFVVGIQASCVGMNKVAPIHGILAAVQSFTVPPGRRVSVHFARALVPALGLGYVIPTLFAFKSAQEKTGGFASNWLLAGTPLLFSVCATAFASALRWWGNTNQTITDQDKDNVHSEPEGFDRYKKDDIPALRTTYKVAMASQAAVHAVLLAHAYVCLKATPSQLAGLPFLLSGAMGVMGETLYSILNLRLLGYVTSWQAAKVSLLSAVSLGVLGPGATLAGVWWWREEVIASYMKDPEASQEETGYQK